MVVAEPRPLTMAVDHDFDTLLTRYGARLYGFVHRLAGAEAAEDLCQEAWVAIYRALPSFRGDAKVTTWMFAIAARVCDRQRRRARLTLVEDADTDSHADERPGPEADALRCELALQVRAAIDQLPRGQREAVHLRCIEDLSYAEIADVLSIPLGTVRSRLHHGMSRLADLLEPYLETSHDAR